MSSIAAGIRRMMMKIEAAPDVPAPKPEQSPPPTPSQDTASAEVEKKKQQEREEMAETERRSRLRGGNKTLLTSGLGDQEEAPVQRRTLLGGS